MDERADQHERSSDVAGNPLDDRQIEEISEESPEDARVAALIQHTIDIPVLAEAVALQDAADAADTLEQIQEEEAGDVLEAMADQAAAETLAEMVEPLAVIQLEDLVDENKTSYGGRLLELMAPDDAADLLQAVHEQYRESLLRAINPRTAAQLRRLAGYAEDTAAGLMTTEFIALKEAMTVHQATEAIRATAISDELNTLPVVDDASTLVGVIRMRTLLVSAEHRLIGDLMERAVRAVHFEVDQEEVAREFDRYDVSMLPVIDQKDLLLGVITVDDVIDIIHEEQTEDVQKTVGAGKEEAVYSRLSEKFRGRFPWLVTSLFMTCMAAIVVLFFEELIRTQPILAFLMPVIAALVGNAGHQALAVTLRGIVLDEVRPGRVRKLVQREAAVGLLNGCSLGVLMFFVVWLLSLAFDGANWQIGLVAGIALAISMCAGTLAGSGIPLAMRRLGTDPAQSSAIFLIMITDAVAFATFLSLAHFATQWIITSFPAV